VAFCHVTLNVCADVLERCVGRGIGSEIPASFTNSIAAHVPRTSPLLPNLRIFQSEQLNPAAGPTQRLLVGNCCLPGAPRDWNTAYVKLVYALIILPAVAIAAELIYSVYSGRWRRLACWITASVLFALLAATLTVIVPSQGSIDLGERYAWDGWYLIWFPGAYVTGILVIAERALGTAYRSARQLSGGRSAPDR
jgi:hypothetical protein